MSILDSTISGLTNIASNTVGNITNQISPSNIVNSFQNQALSKVSEITKDIPFVSTGLSDLTGIAKNAYIPQNFAALTNNFNTAGISKTISDLGVKLPSFGATDLKQLSGGNAKSKGAGYFVTLKSKSDTVVFDVMPTISESRDTNYDSIDLAHAPTPIMKYRNTSGRAWSVGQIRLISRNPAEATANQLTLNILRSWQMPYYGYGTESENASMLGAPPEILTFNAYGSNIQNITVVLTHLAVSWPNDIDYIETTNKEPFPVILTIDISLAEAWSPQEISGFSLAKYRQGDMSKAFQKITPPVKKDTKADIVPLKMHSPDEPINLKSKAPLADTANKISDAAKTLGLKGADTVRSPLATMGGNTTTMDILNKAATPGPNEGVKNNPAPQAAPTIALGETTTEKVTLSNGATATVTSGYEKPRSRDELLAAGYIPASQLDAQFAKIRQRNGG